MFLAPYLYIGGFIIYARTLAFIFLIFFILQIRGKLKRSDYEPFTPYVVLLSCSFLFVITAEQFDSALNSWLASITSLFYLFYLYGIMKTDKKSVSLFKWTLFGIMLAVVIYGLVLTTIPGLNPYLMILQPLFGQEFNEAYALGGSGLDSAANMTLAEGRMFGRISSFFTHPMVYGLNLGFFFIYVIYIFKNKPKLLVILLTLIITAIFTSGVRTPIGALAVTVIAMMLYMRKFKYFFFGTAGFLAVIYLLPLISPEMSEYVFSIVNPDDSNTTGSNMDMRLRQLEGCFNIVQNDFLIGKGYGWEKWYNASFGTHPQALWFESLLFCVLVDTGIIGIILWVVYGFKYYKYAQTKIYDPTLRVTILSLLVYFVSYCMITGDFDIRYMYVFFTIMICLNQPQMDINGKSE